MAYASFKESGKYGSEDLVDDFLMNQMAKEINDEKIGYLARDLGISISDYEENTQPNVSSQNKKINKVRNQHLVESFHADFRFVEPNVVVSVKV